MNLLEVLMPDSEMRDHTDKIFGVVVGIVTNIQDPEKLGRVKVRFPWLSEQDESNWARIAVLMAGKERGTFFLPEVEDEVLCAFELGDVRFPYVLGALWNGVDIPPRDNADGKNNERVIHSRSGHELIFNDEDGKEQVLIKTKAGHELLLDDTSGSEKIVIKDKTGSNSIQIDSAQNAIAFEGQTKISLKAQQVEIEATSSLKIKGMQLEIAADAAATLKSSSVLTIQGSVVKIN
ncbi:MAG TPA: phage baseplate assembly protein V [Pyrinomonadaceae bacterium]|nr:phage baseplate assembly protein V [Pyrinomonadaceae bacterium]